MNFLALRERRQILCSRRWFRELKNFSWRRNSCRHGVVVITVRFIGITGMDMYLPAVPFMPNAGTTASTPAYADNVLGRDFRCRSALLVWTGRDGPISAAPFY